MDIKNTAKAFIIECKRNNRCKECLYRHYCNNLFKENEVPCKLEQKEIEYILYSRIFGCIDVSSKMNEFKNEEL